MVLNLFIDLKGWLEYNYGIVLTSFQAGYIEVLFDAFEGLPVTSKELEKRLKDFLPKKTK